MTADRREHRQPKATSRTSQPVPDRCHPTLYVRFVDERAVEVEHRHIHRSDPSGQLDPGCSGACVGSRDVLPLSYLYD